MNVIRPGWTYKESNNLTNLSYVPNNSIYWEFHVWSSQIKSCQTRAHDSSPWPSKAAIIFLLLASLRDTLGVLKLPTIMFISSIQSHIEGAHLVDFTDFGAPFILTFSRRGHIEVVSENTSSRTLYFNVIYPPTPSSENLFNNALTSFVRVKSPQESPASSIPLIDNIFQCTWMNNKGIGPLIWLCLAISQAHTRPWLVLSVQPQAKLSTPTIVEHFNSSKIKLCACVETKPRSLL